MDMEGFNTTCRRCRARTADTKLMRLCKACTRFLEDQNEVRRKLDSTNKVIEELIRATAIAFVVTNQAEASQRILNNLGEHSLMCMTADNNLSQLSQDEAMHLNRLVQFLNQQVFFWEGVMSEREKESQ